MTDNKKEDANMLKLKGKIMWPKLFAPDTKFTPRYTLDLLLDAEGLKVAKANALRIRKVDPKKGKAQYENLFEGYDGSYLRIDRPVKNRAGKDLGRPVVKDSSGRSDVPADVKIGNGTNAYVRFMVKTRDIDGKTMSLAEAMKSQNGYGQFLTGVQILNLVPYENASNPDTDFVEEKDGDFSSGFDFEKGDSAFDDETPNNI